MRKLIIIRLIRKRLGLKKYELFKFVGQKSKDVYYFDEEECMLMKLMPGHDLPVESGVSLNYILSSECKIRRVGNVNDK